MDFSKLPKPNIGAIKPKNIGEMMSGLNAYRKPPGKLTPGESVSLEKCQTRLVHKTKVVETYDLSTSKKAIKQILSLPNEGESIHCLMGGDYHGFDLVIAIQAIAGQKIDRLLVATLGFNRHNIAHLCKMLDGGLIGDVGIVCSHYFMKSTKDDYAYGRKEMIARGFPIAVVRSHAKVLLFSIGERRYVVESSANLRSCRNIEQFTIFQSPVLHDFHRTWIEHILAHNG